MSFRIIGVGHCMPDTAVSNDELARFLDTSDQWIAEHTGIRQRYLLMDQKLHDIGAAAARRAMESAGVEAADLDLIICTSVQGQYVTPSVACLIAGELGAKCAAFDLNGACTGFLYALDVAAAYLDSGRAGRILIVSAEAMSRLADWTDRSTCVLFGDGAGAAVLEKGEGLLAMRLCVNGGMNLLRAPAYPGNYPFLEAEATGNYLYMNGQEVYKFAVRAVCDDVEHVLDMAGLQSADIDYYILHQANARIIEAICQKLAQPREKFPINIDRCANTSSATIPILIDQLVRNSSIKAGDLLLLSAFGAGLTNGACIIRWGG